MKTDAVPTAPPPSAPRRPAAPRLRSRRGLALTAHPVLLSLLLAGGLACGSDLLAPPPRPVAYEDWITSGRLASFDGVTAGAERMCADETRFATLVEPGTELRLRVDLGDLPVLTLSACRAGNGPGGRRRAEPLPASALRVEVRGADGLASDLELPVDGAAWSARDLDLRAHAGERIELRLRTESPRGTRLLVSDLHVRHRPAEAPVTGTVEGADRSNGPDRSDRRTGRPPAGPPILLISLDTLRADAVTPETAPALTAFAEHAERFAPHYAAASWTKPSHASLLTGFPPAVHGAQLESQPIAPAVPTLAERFRAAGYRTAGLAYDCEWLDARWGFDRGFTEYRVNRWHADAAVRASVDWMTRRSARDRGAPFFYFLHLYAPHSDWFQLPYEATGVDRGTVAERFGVEDYGCREGGCASQLLSKLNDGMEPLPREEEILRYLYLRGVGATDAVLGRLFEDLRAAGLFDRLMIVVTSDHGEGFFEHGLVGHRTLHREILEVPLLVKWPAGSPEAERAGTTSRVPSASIDVAPTLLAAAGIEASGAPLPGTFLPAREAVTPIFAGTTGQSIVTRRLHAIFTPARHDRPEESDLYDLGADPAERHDLAAERPEDLERLRRRLRQHFRESHRLRVALGVDRDGPGADGGVELTPEERKRLEALGYLN